MYVYKLWCYTASWYKTYYKIIKRKNPISNERGYHLSGIFADRVAKQYNTHAILHGCNFLYKLKDDKLEPNESI